MGDWEDKHGPRLNKTKGSLDTTINRVLSKTTGDFSNTNSGLGKIHN